MKILVIRLGRIGDMILSTSLLKQLESNIDNVQIDVLASKDNHKILEFADYVDNVFLWDKNPLKLFSLLSKLRFRKYDVILEPKDHYSTESYYIANMIKAKRKIGFVKNDNSVFTEGVSQYADTHYHFQDKVLSTLLAFGIIPDYSLRVPLSYPSSETDIRKKNRIILNISASKESKKLPEDLVSYILSYLKEKEIEISLMYAPEDRQLAQDISNATGVELCKTKSIIDTFELIDNARAVISADTSIVHIAGTYNTPILVISKSIDKELEKFAPKSDFNIVVKSLSQKRIEVDKSELIIEINNLLDYTKI